MASNKSTKFAPLSRWTLVPRVVCCRRYVEETPRD